MRVLVNSYRTDGLLFSRVLPVHFYKCSATVRICLVISPSVLLPQGLWLVDFVTVRPTLNKGIRLFELLIHLVLLVWVFKSWISLLMLREKEARMHFCFWTFNLLDFIIMDSFSFSLVSIISQKLYCHLLALYMFGYFRHMLKVMASFVNYGIACNCKARLFDELLSTHISSIDW